jgi:hypothetical protein
LLPASRWPAFGDYGHRAGGQGVTQKGQAMQGSAKNISFASSGLLMLVLLASCTTIPTTATTPDVCLIWKPVTYSGSEDSAETIRQVREQNAMRDAYCASR